MRRRDAARAADALEVLEVPHPEEDPHDEGALDPQGEGGQHQRAERHTEPAQHEPVEAASSSPAAKDHVDLVGVLARQQHRAAAEVAPLPQELPGSDDVALPADGVPVERERVPGRGEPPTEVEILAAVGPGEVRVEPAHAQEDVPADRHLAGDEVAELDSPAPLLDRLPAVLGPSADRLREEARRRVRVQRQVPDHGVGALPVRAVVLREQAGMSLHVVVEEQEKLARGGLGTTVAGGGAAGVRLLDDGERERRRESLERLGRPVGGTVDDDDHLERRRMLLRLERPHRGDDDVPALVGRDDDADA